MSVPAEILQGLESSLQDLLDLSVLVPALEGRPVFAPMISDLKSPQKDSIHLLIEYVTRQGQQAMTALIASLESTSELCQNHKKALDLIKENSKSDSSQLRSGSKLIGLLRESIEKLETNIDVLPLLPRLMQQRVVSSENFRDLRAPYISQGDRVQRLVSVLEAGGTNGIIELLIALQEQRDVRHQQVLTLLINKVQALVQTDSEIREDTSLLLKLEKVGVKLTPGPSVATTAPQDKIAIVLQMSEYLTLGSDKKLNKFILPRQELLLKSIADQGYSIVDVGSVVIKEHQSNPTLELLKIMVQSFKQHVVARCNAKTVVIVYISGLTYQTKSGTTCLLLEGAHIESRNVNDCITDEQLKSSLDHLPTPLITVISDCQWNGKEVKFPWKQLCPWNKRTVVMTTTLMSGTLPAKHGQFTEAVQQEFDSWCDRECPNISHYQFYQSLVHGWSQKHPDSTPPFLIMGDTDRSMNSAYSLPTPPYLFGEVYGGQQIALGCGYVMKLWKGQELRIAEPTQPETHYKAVIDELTDTTCIATFDATIESNIVHVMYSYSDQDKIVVTVDIADKMKREVLVDYLKKSPRLRHNRFSGKLKVRQVLNKFEITDASNTLKGPVLVSSIELVKSLLERCAHYLLMRSLDCRMYRMKQQHKCFLYPFPSDHLSQPKLVDKEEMAIESSSQVDGYPEINALCQYEEDKYWKPSSVPATFRATFKTSHYITRVELRAHPDTQLQHQAPVSLNYNEKITLERSRFEGPTQSKKMVTISLNSLDSCGQRQNYSVASVIKITPLKMDPTVDSAQFIFSLMYDNTTNGGVEYVDYFKLKSDTQYIECSPAPVHDGSISVQSGKPLIITFARSLDPIELQITATPETPIPVNKLIVLYPDNGKPVEIFDIELWSQANQDCKLSPFTELSMSITNLTAPIVAGELIFTVEQNYPLQIQFHGSPIGDRMTVPVNKKLKLVFWNDSVRPVYLTLICMEQTGNISCILSQVNIGSKQPYENFINLTLPGCNNVVDTYRAFVSCSPLRLESLQQTGVHNYFSTHQYTIPKLESQLEQESDEQWYCYQFIVQVINK